MCGEDFRLWFLNYKITCTSPLWIAFESGVARAQIAIVFGVACIGICRRQNDRECVTLHLLWHIWSGRCRWRWRRNGCGRCRCGRGRFRRSVSWPVTTERSFCVATFIRCYAIVTTQHTFIVIFTESRFGIQSVAGAATLQPNACVRTDCVVTSLGFQAIVIVDLAFVDICDHRAKLINEDLSWFDGQAYNTLPTQAFVTLSNEKPILQSHLNEPGVLTQFWLLPHEFRSTEHSSISAKSAKIKFMFGLVSAMALPIHLSKYGLNPVAHVIFFDPVVNGLAITLSRQK